MLLSAITSQIDWWWRALFRERVAGLGDYEFHWEPVPGAWTIKQNEKGEWGATWPPPGDPPVTTIAWRLAHIGGMGDKPRRPDVQPSPRSFPTSAKAALAHIDRGWEIWRADLEWLGDEGLTRALGDDGRADVMQMGRDDPTANRVMHQQREFIHHGAEVGLLRDLYWAVQKQEPFVDAVLRDDLGALEDVITNDPEAPARTLQRLPDLVARTAHVIGLRTAERLLSSGFAANADARLSALHVGARRGSLELARLFVEAGADTALRDWRYRLTPLEYASHEKHDDVVEFLRTVGAP